MESIRNIDDAMPRFLPAPVDLHVHGGGGFDVMGGESALRQMLIAQAGMGTGALLATSVAAPIDAIDAFLVDVVCWAHIWRDHS